MKHARSYISLLSAAILSGGFFCASADALTIEAGPFREEIPNETSASWLSVGTRLIPFSTARSEIENTAFCDAPVLCSWNLSRRSRETAAVRTSNETNPDAIRSYITTLSSRITRAPKNARFGVGENGGLITTEESADGVTANEPEILSSIEQALRNGIGVIHVPVRIEKPEFSSDSLAALGIKDLIAEGTTDFTGSPKNRIHNIKRALEQFQGIIIKPDEELSFVKYLGEVDGAHGYLPELVIKYNKTEPEFGGGICQVSSTLFRAAVNAGFKITARKNHAYPVRYYKPYGMDATIYIPNPDFRFVNNSATSVLILSSIEGSKLTFHFYGAKDGRSVEIDGPHILESNPDGSMKTTFSQKVTDANGKAILNDTFPSSYKSPDLYPHFEILSEKPKEWTKKQWSEYLVQKNDYEAKLRAAYATVVRDDPPKD